MWEGELMLDVCVCVQSCGGMCVYALDLCVVCIGLMPTEKRNPLADPGYSSNPGTNGSSYFLLKLRLGGGM